MKSFSDAVQGPKLTHHISRFIPDRLITILILAFVGLAIVDQVQAYRSMAFTIKSMTGITPFFLLAIVFAGYAKASGADRLIAKAFSGKAGMTVMAAALAGALSPFCSCGVIPLIAAMLASGVPLAPVMAFCISSPIMDPEMFILTAAGINLNFAVAKTIAAIGMGLTAGFTVFGLQKAGFLKNPLKKAVGCGCGEPSFNTSEKIQVVWRFWHYPKLKSQFIEEVQKSGGFLFKWMLFAFFLESLMVAYIPAEWIVEMVGSGNNFAIPLAAVVGIPAYMNGYAAIPLVAGLMEMGMIPGSAMTFITSGAVSSIPAALAVYALVRKPVFAVYLTLGLLGSIIAGYAYQFSGFML
ncbi:MAG: permease [Desulfobacterales bacterium]|nr:MAG: permease [Desulfobacterales bacterium]UCD88432.1 MAG: permease [Desulfobacterales bacterium]